jgi:hypothetical protein
LGAKTTPPKARAAITDPQVWFTSSLRPVAAAPRRAAWKAGGRHDSLAPDRIFAFVNADKPLNISSLQMLPRRSEGGTMKL